MNYTIISHDHWLYRYNVHLYDDNKLVAGTFTTTKGGARRFVKRQSFWYKLNLMGRFKPKDYTEEKEL